MLTSPAYRYERARIVDSDGLSITVRGRPLPARLRALTDLPRPDLVTTLSHKQLVHMRAASMSPSV